MPPRIAALVVLVAAALAGCSALVRAYLDYPDLRPLQFEEGATPADAPAFARSGPDDPYLTRLRETYGLDSVVAGAASDYERVLRLSRWVRSRWDHNGQSTPSRGDPITILEEAAEGQRFRCVEYGVVLAGALNAVGVPARVLALKTSDVETRRMGAGHVVAEAYLRDRGKWVMVDGQFDAVATLDGVPLSAVELQRALVERPDDVRIEGASAMDARRARYPGWIAPYLFYFDVALDGRYSGTRQAGRLMLVPVGAPEPRVFQRDHPLRDLTYTRSIAAFYTPPAAPTTPGAPAPASAAPAPAG